MDFYSKDLEAWINEAQADPQTAAQIITALAGRITQLQLQNDALLAENLLLKRASGGAYLEQIERLRAGMADIKSWAIRHRLERQTVLAASFSGEVLQFMIQRSDRFEKESEQTFSLKTSEDKPLA
ncbi:MAG TPA: hypothetical protein PL074_06375, partial [Thermoflexales bacterium]|nr:hypothetical protein [Thermoflexales bacterium]